MCKGFSNFSAALKREIIIKFLLYSLETLTSSKESRIKILFRLSFAVIFANEHCTRYNWLSEQLFTVTQGYMKARTGFLKKVSGGIFIIIK
jgi:hypothetical protein